MATTPEASPAPSNSTGNFSNEKNNEIKEIHEDTYLHLPDIHIFSNDPIPDLCNNFIGFFLGK